MKKLLVTAALAFATLAAFAQASGEVTKIDKAGARVTLKHDGVKSLDMPPMTMAFRVPDAKVLDNLAVGDKVRFAAEKVNGSYTLTTLQKAP